MKCLISSSFHTIADIGNCCCCRLHAKYNRYDLTMIDGAHWGTWQLVGYANPGMITHSNRRMLMLARGYLNTCQEGWRNLKLTGEICSSLDLPPSCETEISPTAASDLIHFQNHAMYKIHRWQRKVENILGFLFFFTLSGSRFCICYKYI